MAGAARKRWLVMAGAALAVACAPLAGQEDPVVAPAPTTTTGAPAGGAGAAQGPPAAPPATQPAPVAAPAETTAAPPSPTAAPAPPATEAPPPPAPPPVRQLFEQPWTPFATVGGITLLHPADRVERVGFHEANHDGAHQLEPLPSAAAPVTLEGRNRGTDSRTAADVVVPPDAEIRSPVTGTVKRAGRYTLYCRYSDDFVVIAPDEQPGWEVKLLHISGVQVGRGQRVTAGQTVLAPRPTPLPFESQVDEHRSADPAWPHVHIEVVDPSIPDRPAPGGGGGGCP